MKDQFINSKIIGIIYKNLVTKLNLQLSSEEKTKLTKKMINVMNQVYSNIDSKRVTASNYKSILRQFINNCYVIVYNDINKDAGNNRNTQENFAQESKMDRDRQIMGDRKNILDPRNSYSKDDRFASFNDSFPIPPRQQNTAGYQGRLEPTQDFGGRKSDFAETLDKRYQDLQSEYKGSFNTNRRPTTPPELKGDGGANLNKMARENIKNKQLYNNSNNNGRNGGGERPPMSAQEFLKPMDPKSKGGANNVPRDNFDFGTANDVDNNYDTLDGSGNDYQGNMDMRQWNTGINPNKFNIDENEPLEQRLKKYQSDRDNMDKGSVPGQRNGGERQDDKKQVRFNDENSFREAQMQEQYDMEQDKLREEQERQNRMRELNRDRTKREGDRMVEIRREPVRVPEAEGFSSTVEAKLGEYENTIGLLLDKVKDLQQQQIKAMSGTNGDADDKIRLLEAKKGEILGEVTRLQSYTLALEKQQQEISEKERSIKLRELDIDQKMRKYAGIRNMDERQVMIKASSGRFTYTLNESCQNVTGIQLLNYNIPYDEHNINANNNKLYFSVISDNSTKAKDESDDDILTTDSENYVDEVYINANKLYVMTIPESNYDIFGLLEIMNKLGNKFDIHFSLVKGKVVIKTNKNNRLKLYLDREYQNNILASLGFSRIIGDKYRHVSEKKYNIRNDKLVQLFIKNIESGPFAEFMIGSSKVHKFAKELNIENLNRLDIEIRLSEKIFTPQEPYILEFNILMNNAANSLVVETNKSKQDKEEEVNTDEEDLLSRVSNMINTSN